MFFVVGKRSVAGFNNSDFRYKIWDSKDGVAEWWSEDSLHKLGVFIFGFTGSYVMSSNDIIVSEDVKIVVLYETVYNHLAVALISNTDSIQIVDVPIDDINKVYNDGYPVYRLADFIDFLDLRTKIFTTLQNEMYASKFSFISSTEKKFSAERKLLTGVNEGYREFHIDGVFSEAYANRIVWFEIKTTILGRDKKFGQFNLFKGVDADTRSRVGHKIAKEFDDYRDSIINSILKKNNLQDIVKCDYNSANEYHFEFTPQFYHNNCKLLDGTIDY